jgi:Gly-Xaa carboxypeptidase
MSSELKDAILRSAKSDKALKAAEEILLQDRVYESLMGTTQAIDLIQGGVKSNALPEQAWAIVNHRIATDRSVFLHSLLSRSLPLLNLDI